MTFEEMKAGIRVLSNEDKQRVIDFIEDILDNEEKEEFGW